VSQTVENSESIDVYDVGEPSPSLGDDSTIDDFQQEYPVNEENLSTPQLEVN